MSLEYDAIFLESRFVGDVEKGMRNEFPVLDVKESRRLAEKSLTWVRGQGNLALYEGLVKVGLEYAIRQYQESGSEGSTEEF